MTFPFKHTCCVLNQAFKMAEVSKNTRRSQAPKRSYPKRNISNDHSLRKRTPQKQVNQENAVYVTKKTNIKALIKKCEKLFEKNFNEIVIHCMGAAIQQGINLALQLCEKYPNYQLSVNTSTITLTDDLEPLTDEADYETQRRQNSALHIKVIRTNLGGEPAKQ